MALKNAFQNLALDATIISTNEKLDSIIGTHNAPFADSRKGLVLLGKRMDSDSTTVDDGDLNTFNLDEEGRLKVSSKPSSYADITGDITTIQATIGTPVAGGTVSGNVSRASNIMAFCTGTFSTVNCTFEGSIEASGDTNWFVIQAVRSNANTIETATGNLSAQPIYGWEMSVNALKRVRVRATARTSGTQSWRFVQGTYATEPIPAAQVTAAQSVTQSGTWTVQVGNTANTSPILANPFLPVVITTGDTGAKIANGNGATQLNVSSKGALITFNIGAVTGTLPTAVFKIQGSADGGTTWLDLPNATTATIIATGAYGIEIYPATTTVAGVATSGTMAVVNIALPKSWRVYWTIGGTTPSFTITNIQVAYII